MGVPEIENHIVDILNAAPTWGGTIVSKRRSPEAVTQARIEATMEVMRAIASNPQSSYFGSLATMVTVENGDFLPAHEGEPGIPLIIPYPGAEPRSGIPADPDEIDSYMYDITTGPYRALYSGAVDAQAVAYNEQTKGGRISPTACRYSIINGQIKFTGDSVQVPLVQLDPDAADFSDKVPTIFEPLIVKLAIPKLVKEGDNLSVYAAAYERAAYIDLASIRAGSNQISPLSTIMLAQKAS